MAVEGAHEEFVILNNHLITGIQNISFTQNVEEGNLSMMGEQFVSTSPTGPTTTNVSIRKILVNNDALLSFTGSAISGQFIYGDNYLNFNSGFLTNYAVSAEIGALPLLSCDLEIYGLVTGSTVSLYNQAIPETGISEVLPTGLVVTHDKEQTNAITSFSFSEVYNYQPLYGVGNGTGNLLAQQVTLLGPVTQNSEINLDIEDHSIESNTGFFAPDKNRNRNIKFEIHATTGLMLDFTLQNAHLISENVNGAVSDSVLGNIQYRGYKKV